jgi:hypothetical protein
VHPALAFARHCHVALGLPLLISILMEGPLLEPGRRGAVRAGVEEIVLVELLALLG